MDSVVIAPPFLVAEFSHLTFPITDEDQRRIDAALEREREFI